MSKHVRNCLDDILERIANLENRLNQMEKDFIEHVLNDKVHVNYKSYRSESRGPASPPPPPPSNYNKSFKPITAPPRPKRQSSAPGRMQTPVNDGISKDAPIPPPLPNKLRL